MRRYNPQEIEPKWQQVWSEKKAFEAVDFSDKPKTYISPMFPYPSGAGMHTGHIFEHAIVDAIARFSRGNGHNVLNPMGWDSFGLPAENYAIKTGTPPAETTKTNIANFKRQLERVGVSIDWSREINTSDPEYYRWTQWIFTQLFERGLAYQKDSLQWWCEIDQTVLANEQVVNGKCWRHDGADDPLAVKKNIRQWFFKITDYADALLEEIPALDWPEKIKTAQTNWIGRSQGAEVDFAIAGTDEKITVFTTRPDTIFGATFLVLAPEHPLAKKLAAGTERDAVEAYVTDAVKKTEMDRLNDTKEKTGVFTGAYALNPATDEKIPIWVADYVLGGYGTGAIMAVPAHDERDYEFAKKFELPVVQVVADYTVGTGRDTPRDDLETLHRPVVDAIITDGKGKYLLQIENEHHVHFVGGGIDETDDNTEAALRREVIEEVGLTEVLSIKQASPYSSGIYLRETKNRNQKVWGTFYEVVVDPSVQVESEIEQGLHSIEWVDKADIAERLTWGGHQKAWQAYLAGTTIDTDVREGLLVNSGHFDGMATDEAREEIVRWLEEKGIGRSKITYKMRDWLISRQRYWGAPIPIIHCEEHGAVPVPADQLPVRLPEVEDFAPRGDGKSVLAHVEDWVNTTCPTCGKPAKRETDTMDGYACSSWYLLRYTDPNDSEQAWDPKLANYWAPVDFYVGGDHAVAHLLYVRFWTHVFKDLGLVDFKEPVKKLIYHGYINAEDGTKMSKSKGNVVDPVDVIDQGYGADALRTYVLFMGPIELDASWDPRGIAGIYRFINRVWTLVQEFDAADKSFTGNDAQVVRAQHKTARKVTDDIRRQSFNTAIAALMEYVNELYKLKVDGFSDTVWREALSALAQLISPFAPHVAEELWQQLGHEGLIQETMWPQWDDAYLVSDTITVIVQVNGKLRAKLEVASDATKETIEQQALANDHVQTFVGGKEPKKIIYIPGKLVNIVV